jgi:hypothetical protein
VAVAAAAHSTTVIMTMHMLVQAGAAGIGCTLQKVQPKRLGIVRIAIQSCTQEGEE